MLELCDAKLELVDLVAEDEIQLLGESRAGRRRACSESFAWLPRIRSGKLGEELAERVGRRYRARPCGLVRRRWRRFSRRACALGSDGSDWIDVHELRRRLGGERLLGLLERSRSRIDGVRGAVRRLQARRRDRRRTASASRTPARAPSRS